MSTWNKLNPFEKTDLQSSTYPCLIVWRECLWCIFITDDWCRAYFIMDIAVPDLVVLSVKKAIWARYGVKTWAAFPHAFASFLTSRVPALSSWRPGCLSAILNSKYKFQCKNPKDLTNKILWSFWKIWLLIFIHPFWILYHIFLSYLILSLPGSFLLPFLCSYQCSLSLESKTEK